jgi:hypothetical protein
MGAIFTSFGQNTTAPKDSSKSEFAILRYHNGIHSKKFGRLTLVMETKVVNMENVPEFSIFDQSTSKIAEDNKLILSGLKFLHQKYGYELVSSMAYVEGGDTIKEFVLRK